MFYLYQLGTHAFLKIAIIYGKRTYWLNNNVQNKTNNICQFSL